jgi:amidohydrolase
MEETDLAADLDAFLARHEDELIAFRRDLHAHPELANAEHRTTRRVALRLTAAGLRPVILPKGTGLTVDIGTLNDQDAYADQPAVALRADLDALPMTDEKDVPYRSTIPNACHACGHDVHTTVLLGTGLYLAERAAAGALPGRVRLIFQPAEEAASGALDVLAAGGIADVGRIFALHCDPRLDAGQLGVRSGAITAACDRIQVRLSGPGGHTARPHLTVDLVYALGKIITEVPAALSRRVDPRSSLSLVWGRVSAGTVANVIPDGGIVEGTVRCLDDDAWHRAPDLLKAIIDAVAQSYGVNAEFTYERYVPPTVNDQASAAMLAAAALDVLGAGSVVQTPQSLGGEDFAWYLEGIPGALARLGTRVPGSTTSVDIHQPTFDVDERAIGIGVKAMVATAINALWDDGAMVAQALPGVTSQ